MADLEALASSPWWRWMPGMAWRVARAFPLDDIVGRVTVLARDPRTLPHPGARPDLDDPATVGCLLALAREAWGEPALHLIPTLDGGWRVVGFQRERDDSVGAHGPTEPDALIAAILAAPPPGVDRG